MSDGMFAIAWIFDAIFIGWFFGMWQKSMYAGMAAFMTISFITSLVVFLRP